MKKYFLIQLNELNIEFIEYYSDIYNLVSIKKILSWSKIKTSSENKYENLEPWIQWVSFYSGKSAEKHGIFRLGDNNKHEELQFFENISNKGIKVGSISPMNAGNIGEKSSFFISDPWSQSEQKGTFFEKKIGSSLSGLVNSNNGVFKISHLSFFLIAVLFKGSFLKNFKNYTYYFFQSFRKNWFRAIFLDFFLSKFHLNMHKKYGTDFSSIFLNCGAHLQHHYALNSPALKEKPYTNPEWFIKNKHDPIKDLMICYEEILKEYLSYKNHKIFIATALSQKPYKEAIFYWRLKDHSNFLNLLGLNFLKVEPRMTRDFLISFQGTKSLLKAHTILSEIKDEENRKLFELIEINENKKTLFVTLTYDQEIETTEISIKNIKLKLKEHLNFVSLKNADHHQMGMAFSNQVNFFKDSEVSIWELGKMVENSIING